MCYLINCINNFTWITVLCTQNISMNISTLMLDNYTYPLSYADDNVTITGDKVSN